MRSPLKARSLLSHNTANKVHLKTGTSDDTPSLDAAVTGCNIIFINLLSSLTVPGLEHKRMQDVISAFLSDSTVPTEEKWVVYSMGIGPDRGTELEQLQPALLKIMFGGKVLGHN